MCRTGNAEVRWKRNDDFDIYAIPAAGGEEKQLTTARTGRGPEYSPDGNYIYFNSERTGHMQIWRMLADGSGRNRLRLERERLVPHISPNGEQMVFLTYDASVKRPSENKDVMLRMITQRTKRLLCWQNYLGGQER